MFGNSIKSHNNGKGDVIIKPSLRSLCSNNLTLLISYLLVYLKGNCVQSELPQPISESLADVLQVSFVHACA